MTAYDYLRRRMARMFGQTHGGARDMWGTFGWPQNLEPQDFMTMYLRNGVASRIVRAFPQATWRDYPLVRDEQGDSGQKEVRGKPNKNYSPFVEEVENFFDTHSVTHYLERADRLSGVGRFGILVMGFGDGGDLADPLPAGNHQLIYLSAYGEPRVKISRLVSDVNDPRYALPEMYEVMPDTSIRGGTIVQNRQFRVHHSRVIHLAEFLDENDVMGTPRLMPVYNHLLDLEKTVGAGAETFWLNSRGGMAITADKDVDIDPAVLADMKQQADEFEHQLRRSIALQGAQASLLSTSIADPKSNVEAALQLIAGGVGIPMRILIGSERGELSSSQDENNWAARIDERQEGYATPRVVKPFIQKMLDTGNIAAPQGKWWIEWPSSASLSPVQQADIAVKKSQALAAYSNAPSAELYVPVQEFRADFLSLPPESEYDLMAIEDEVLPVEGDGGEILMLPGADVEGVENTALNGAQITALRGIIEGVAARTIPTETAVQLIMVGFPGISEDDARKIIEPMENFRAAVTPQRINSVGKLIRLHQLKTNAAPRTLYVRRNVLNAEEIREHFRAQGLAVMTPADEMHVTIAYSRKPVDWMKIPTDWPQSDQEERDGRALIAPGGVRMMDLFGKESPKRVLVLIFGSSRLSWRHEAIREMSGASWDFPDYNPHITISYDVGQSWVLTDLWQDRLKELEPYRGAIELGPEIFEELDEDWKSTLKENARV